MASSSLNDDIRKLIDSGMASTEGIQGCSQEEISSLENKLGHVLPITYKNFLFAMGNGAGKFLSDFTFTAKELEWARNIAFESSQMKALERKETEIDYNVMSAEEANAVFGDMTPSYEIELQASHHVFLLRAGDYYLYFDMKDGDDPPVYKSDQESVFYSSFSSWLHDAIDGETKIFKGELTPKVL